MMIMMILSLCYNVMRREINPEYPTAWPFPSFLLSPIHAGTGSTSKVALISFYFFFFHTPNSERLETRHCSTITLLARVSCFCQPSSKLMKKNEAMPIDRLRVCIYNQGFKHFNVFMRGREEFLLCTPASKDTLFDPRDDQLKKVTIHWWL